MDNMIVMDEFVVALSGQQSQIIERDSKDSSVTMKTIGKTIKRFNLSTLHFYYKLCNFQFDF